MFRLFWFFLSFLDFFIPKKKGLWLFPCQRDDFWKGNCPIFFDWLKSNAPELQLFRLVLSDAQQDSEKAIISIEGLWLLLRSEVVIFHHSPLDAYIPLWSRRRISYHLNHGIHFKKGEYAIDKNTAEYKRIRKGIFRTKYFIPHHSVSSDVDALSACAFFHLRMENVDVNGLARNDLFFMKTIPPHFNAMKERLTTACKDKKLITYAPTWRTESGAYEFTEQEISKLNKFCLENNFIFGYAGHPMLKDRTVPNSEHFIDLNKMDLDIQLVLLQTDILITDYSSIWIDYLLTDKPILGFMYDLDKFKEDRGMIFSVVDIFPGKISENTDDLLEHLYAYKDGNEALNQKYFMAKKIFHKHKDGLNCQRTYESLLKRIKANK